MEAGDVIAIHNALTEARLDYWVGGGWGADALVGRQTRDHDDLDISIPAGSLAAVVDLLQARGFEAKVDWLPSRLALRDAAGREIDVHPLTFEPDGSAWLPGLDGNRFVYPAGSFTTGTIGGCGVPCISAALQASFHTGYLPQEKDRADMAALQRADLIADWQP